MEFADKGSNLCSQYFFHRAGFRCDHMHFEIACAQRMRYFKTDEAGANHHARCDARALAIIALLSATVRR